MAGVGMASLSVRASWDTLPRLPYNPHNRRKPKTPNSLKPPLNPSPVTLVASPTGTVVPVAELLRRDIQNSSQGTTCLFSLTCCLMFFWVLFGCWENRVEEEILEV